MYKAFEAKPACISNSAEELTHTILSLTKTNVRITEGKDNVVLMDIADYSTPTCSDCGFSAAALEGGSCKDNLKDTGKLTSGYKSGQDMMKLVLYGQTENTGKCSHGSPDDMTRNQTATGGIYKGRSKASEAPHSHLHVQAALAAVSAVQEYIVAKGKFLNESV
ncbi:hypothetical protein FSP39_018952 [Pinctada imbricata]|uniref:VWA7 N-terminal domain-containing protein n=1 Tax=Pinctada imbricata TaxID=66713 RepID=A0AA88YRW4_PINIB|nr:hypothetical protein FSP39_018952 [Pinctada imbricata]